MACGTRAALLKRMLRWAVFCLTATTALACGGASSTLDDDPGPSGGLGQVSGGSTGTGGTTGGAAQSGGTSAGGSAAGGVGSSASGGATFGGAPASGGTATGGAATGGASTGGTSTGGMTTGGRRSSGGAGGVAGGDGFGGVAGGGGFGGVAGGGGAAGAGGADPRCPARLPTPASACMPDGVECRYNALNNCLCAGSELYNCTLANPSCPTKVSAFAPNPPGGDAAPGVAAPVPLSSVCTCSGGQWSCVRR